MLDNYHIGNEHHHDLEMVLGNKAICNLPPETLSSSLNMHENPLNELQEAIQLEASHVLTPDLTSENIGSNTISRPKNKKRKHDDSAPQWFLDFVNQQEKKEERWDELLKIEERKVELLENILSHVNKN